MAPRCTAKKKKSRPRPKLKVGDRVRLSSKHRPFKKGYLPGGAEEVFVVQQVVPGPVVTYKLKDWDGTPLEGSFSEDVQKVTVPDRALLRVEKILRQRGRTMKVHWLGWPSKYDSWVPRSALKHKKRDPSCRVKLPCRVTYRNPSFPTMIPLSLRYVCQAIVYGRKMTDGKWD